MTNNYYYYIVTASDIEALTQKVEQMCHTGWKPHGSMVSIDPITTKYITTKYAQPMVKNQSLYP